MTEVVGAFVLTTFALVLRKVGAFVLTEACAFETSRC